VINDEIVLNSHRECDFNNLKLKKLVGNNLIGLCRLNRKNEDGVWLWQFCTINLETLTEEIIEVPHILNNGRHLPDPNVILFVYLILVYLDISLLLGWKCVVLYFFRPY
jgi:hypothetical protein